MINLNRHGPGENGINWNVPETENRTNTKQIIEQKLEKEETNEVFYVFYGHSFVDTRRQITIQKDHIYVTMVEIGDEALERHIDYKMDYILNDYKNRKLLFKPLLNCNKISNIMNSIHIDEDLNLHDDYVIRVKVESQKTYPILLSFLSDFTYNDKIHFKKTGIYKYSTQMPDVINNGTYDYLYIDTDKGRKNSFDKDEIPLSIIIDMYKDSIYPTIKNVLIELYGSYKSLSYDRNYDNKYDKHIVFIKIVIDNTSYDKTIADELYITYKTLTECMYNFSNPELRRKDYLPHDELFNNLIDSYVLDYKVLYIPSCRSVLYKNNDSESNEETRINLLRKRFKSNNNMLILNRYLPPKINILNNEYIHLDTNSIIIGNILLQWEPYIKKYIMDKHETNNTDGNSLLKDLLNKYISKDALFKQQNNRYIYVLLENILSRIKKNDPLYKEFIQLLLKLLFIIDNNKSTYNQNPHHAHTIKDFFDDITKYISNLTIPEPLPKPRPESKPQPKPRPRPKPTPRPRPKPKPTPQPKTKNASNPQPKPRPRPRTESKPQPKPSGVLGTSIGGYKSFRKLTKRKIFTTKNIKQ